MSVKSDSVYLKFQLPMSERARWIGLWHEKRIQNDDTFFMYEFRYHSYCVTVSSVTFTNFLFQPFCGCLRVCVCVWMGLKSLWRSISIGCFAGEKKKSKWHEWTTDNTYDSSSFVHLWRKFQHHFLWMFILDWLFLLHLLNGSVLSLLLTFEHIKLSKQRRKKKPSKTKSFVWTWRKCVIILVDISLLTSRSRM